MVDEPTIDASSINAGDRAARLDIEEESREEDNIPDAVETDGLSFGEENEEQIDITAVDEPEDDAPADIDSFDQESGPDDSVEDADEMVDESKEESPEGVDSISIPTPEIEVNEGPSIGLLQEDALTEEVALEVKKEKVVVDEEEGNIASTEEMVFEEEKEGVKESKNEQGDGGILREIVVPPIVGTASFPSHDQSEPSPELLSPEVASEITKTVNITSATSRDVSEPDDAIEEDVASQLLSTPYLPVVHSSEDTFTEAPTEDPPLVDVDDDKSVASSSEHETGDFVTGEGIEVKTEQVEMTVETPVPTVTPLDLNVVLDDTIDEAYNMSYIRHSGNAATQAEQTAREMETAVKEILSHASSEDRLDDELSGKSSKKLLSFDQYVVTTSSSIDQGSVLEEPNMKELLPQASSQQPSVVSDGEASPVDSSLEGIISDDAIAVGQSHQRPPLGPRMRDVVVPGTIGFVPKHKSYAQDTTTVGEGGMLELSDRYLQKMKEYKLKKAKRKAKYQRSPTLEEEKEFVDDHTTLSGKELERLEAELEFIRLTEQMNHENEEEHERILQLEEQRKAAREKERDLNGRLAEAEYTLLVAKQEERRMAIEEKKRIAREKKKRVISFLAEVKERTRLVEEAAFDLFNDDGSLASSATSSSLAMIKERIRNRKRPSED